MFMISPQFAEYAAGLDRLAKIGVSLNAPDAQGQTVAKLMKVNVNPEILKAPIARGAQLTPSGTAK
jgi:hypothetical protein